MYVANGTDAGAAREKLVHGNISCEEKERLKTALLAYCNQDTLAMVRVLDQLRGLCLSACTNDKHLGFTESSHQVDA
jgi:hypothetical protein